MLRRLQKWAGGVKAISLFCLDVENVETKLLERLEEQLIFQ